MRNPALADTVSRRRMLARNSASDALSTWRLTAGVVGAECVLHAARGAKVIGVRAGQKMFKEAINEAVCDWVTNVRNYTLCPVYGSCLGIQ